MQYFRSFESNALLADKNESIKYTNCSISTHPAEKYAMHAYVFIW